MLRQGMTRKFEVTPTVKVSGAYTANDVMGGLQTVTLKEGRFTSGTIRRVNLVDDDSEGAALTIYVFDALPSTIADDAAFAPTVADLKKLCGVISVAAGDYVTVNGNDYMLKTEQNIDFNSTTGAVYLYIVCTATPTYTAATDLTLELWVWED